MTECKRNQFSTNPGCRCEDCMVLIRRMHKLMQGGRLPKAPIEAADRVFRQMMRLNYSYVAVASATGVAQSTAGKWLARYRRGERINWRRGIAYALLNAKPPTEGAMTNEIAMRMLRGLARIGWSTDELERTYGIEASTLLTVRVGRHKRVKILTQRRIEAMYGELHMRRGPSRTAELAAIERGWLAPAAWDDIYNLDERPEVTNYPRTADRPADMLAVEKALSGWRDTEGKALPLTTSEKRQAVALGILRGMTLRAIGTATGIKPDRYLYKLEVATPATTQPYAVRTRAGWSYHDELLEAC